MIIRNRSDVQATDIYLSAPCVGDVYLTNTFSPLMLERAELDEDGEFTAVRSIVTEIDFDDFMSGLSGGFISAVSHKITADIISGIINKDVVFNRVNLSLKAGDTVLCAIPQFRAEVAREFTRDEIGDSFRFFIISIK